MKQKLKAKNEMDLEKRLESNTNMDNILETVRKEQLEKLNLCLENLLNNKKSNNAFLFGNNGTGKTFISKYLLNKICPNLKGFYIDCWKNPTTHLVLEDMLRQLNTIVPRLSINEKRKKLGDLLKDKPFLIVLDEIDKIRNSELSNLFYNLLQFEKTSIFCISNNKDSFQKLPKKIREMLMPLPIYFPKYKVQELHEILKKKSNSGINEEILNLIINKSNGNARIGVKLLDHLKNFTKWKKLNEIKIDEIQDSLNEIHEFHDDKLANLSKNEKTLYEIIKENPKINSNKLYRVFHKRHKHLITERSVRRYLEKLNKFGLVNSVRANKRGGLRRYFINNIALKPKQLNEFCLISNKN